MSHPRPDPIRRLEPHLRHVQEVILSRQDPVTGLLPASTDVNAHGDYTHAWVRDNVYSILAAWGVARAYRRAGVDDGPVPELEGAVLKLMRGLLRSMMAQAPKVEAFKRSQHPLDALHAKYDPRTGGVVVPDDAWGHLQIDATSLFLLGLAQMTAGGLRIVWTQDEVDFVQNLVFYIGRAYRTPDYGIWERGDKTNHGEPELNASSVAMAKAALEALAGLDLYGAGNGQGSVVHVLPDEIAKAAITLEALLPRESSSKEVDAALLSAIGFPAFAVDDEDLAEATRRNVATKLSGRYGLKRFLRDGHQTALEDPTRLHYEPEELEQFARIESEWPLFVAYEALDALFRGARDEAAAALRRLSDLAVERDGQRLLPELYAVPAAAIEAERAAPGSQERLPNGNVPLVWAQSLWRLALLLDEGLLDPADLDPLGRHRRRRPARPTVQLALLAEDEALQRRLAERGVAAELASEVAPVRVGRAHDLARIFEGVGRNDKLGLGGRPLRRVHSLTTARAYRLAGRRVVFLPAFFDRREFYLTLDPRYLTERLAGEIAYLHRHWTLPGRPLMTLLLTRDLLGEGEEELLELVDELRTGRCRGVPVALGPLRQLLLAANEERIDDVDAEAIAGVEGLEPSAPLRTRTGRPRRARAAGAHEPLEPEAALAIELERDAGALRARLAASSNLFEQVEVLEVLARRGGLSAPMGAEAGGTTVRERLEEVYAAAGAHRLWGVVRRAAGLLEKTDVGLADALNDVLVVQKHVVLGKAYSEASTVTRPLPQPELLERIREFCRDDTRDRVLTQEVLIYLSSLIKAEPELFRGLLTLRVGHLILLLASELAAQQGVTQDEAYDRLMALAPCEVQGRLRQVLASYHETTARLREQESLQASRGAAGIRWPLGEGDALPDPPGGWWRWRQREGALNRVPAGFYPDVWRLLRHCHGVVIGDKLDRRNRLDSRLLLARTTAGEKNFALRVEHLLNKIPSPEYRQLSVEALVALGRLVDANPGLRVEGPLVLDVLVGHAVRVHWTERWPERAERYDQHKAEAWGAFYDQPPARTSDALVRAFRALLREGGEPELEASA